MRLHCALVALVFSLGCAGDKSDSDRALVDADSDGASAAEDCDDQDASVHPGASETCDGVDNDCDGLVDDADDSLVLAGTVEAWLDADGDGHGGAERVYVCVVGEGVAEADGDCDDADPSVHPDAEEICGNGLDDNCDGAAAACRLEGTVRADEADAVVFDGNYVGSEFGHVFSLGDFNGDGHTDMAVGAPDRAGFDEERDAGRVWLVLGPLDTEIDVSRVDSVSIGGGDDHAFAGTALSMDGDVDGDGMDELLFTMPGREASVLVWGDSVSTGRWATVDELLEDTGGVWFEHDSAYEYADGDAHILGDIDGDGLAEFVLGVGVDRTSAHYGGRLDLFRGDRSMAGGPVDERVSLTLLGDGDFAHLGRERSVANGPDLDGDGRPDLVASTACRAEGEDCSGFVHVVLSGSLFDLSGTQAIGDVEDLRIEGHHNGDYLGSAVDSAGDLNGDGTVDLVVGAHAYDAPTGWNAGAVTPARADPSSAACGTPSARRWCASTAPGSPTSSDMPWQAGMLMATGLPTSPGGRASRTSAGRAPAPPTSSMAPPRVCSTCTTRRPRWSGCGTARGRAPPSPCPTTTTMGCWTSSAAARATTSSGCALAVGG